MSIEQALAENTSAIRALLDQLSKGAITVTTVAAPNASPTVNTITVAAPVAPAPVAAAPVESPKKPTPPAPTPTVVAAPAAPVAVVETATASPSEPAAPTAQSVSVATVEKVAINRPAVIELLAQFGARRASEVKPAQYGEYLALLAQIGAA